ncbi:hypothetical protein [Haliangium sp.]|uniref:hypothetical protein n=1 Tax=Haliangium sp. TaxID=2663208 RepID=UPI003D0FBA72
MGAAVADHGPSWTDRDTQPMQAWIEGDTVQPPAAPSDALSERDAALAALANRAAAAPLYPIFDPSPPRGAIARGTKPLTPYLPTNDRVAASISRDVTILQRGLDNYDPARLHQPAPVEPPSKLDYRVWAALAGFALGWVVILLASLFF